MSGERIYLDHASGGALSPVARAAMEEVLARHGAAPGGGHREARESRDFLERARNQAAGFLGLEDPEGIVFTSGGTESVQSAVLGWGEAAGSGTIYVSEMEHPAVESAVQKLGKKGFVVVRIPVDGEGRFQWRRIKSVGPGLVCVHLAHHDLGTVQDLKTAAAFAKEAKARLFVDATFGAGWVELPKRLEGVDALAISGHRIGGPKGSGILWVRSGFPWKAQMGGGRQEGDRRSGTENLPAIVGLGVAAEEWLRHGEMLRKDTRKAQKALADGIEKNAPIAKLHGPRVGEARSPAHLAFSFAGLEAESLALVMDRVGLAVRGGSGCVTREMKIPPAMKAIGAKPEEARALILFTLGLEMKVSQMEMAVERVEKAVKRLEETMPR